MTLYVDVVIGFRRNLPCSSLNNFSSYQFRNYPVPKLPSFTFILSHLASNFVSCHLTSCYRSRGGILAAAKLKEMNESVNMGRHLRKKVRGSQESYMSRNICGKVYAAMELSSSADTFLCYARKSSTTSPFGQLKSQLINDISTQGNIDVQTLTESRALSPIGFRVYLWRSL